MGALNGMMPVKMKIDGEEKFYISRIQISNFIILCLIKKIDNLKGKYLIYNYFDSKGNIKIVRGDKENICSIYSVLTSNDYVELSNINFEEMLQSYKDLVHLNERIYESANYDLLNLLLAFDKNNSSKILNTAKEIASWIFDQSGDLLQLEIKTLNYLQTIKRERVLSDNENLRLCHIAEKSDNIMYKLGANLLLENYKVTHLQFNKLSKEDKEIFKSFPIYKFWKEPYA